MNKIHLELTEDQAERLTAMLENARTTQRAWLRTVYPNRKTWKIPPKDLESSRARIENHLGFNDRILEKLAKAKI